MLSDFFDKKELCKSVNPDEAVAYGAAIQAAILTGKKDKTLQLMVLLDVTPLSLGVETQGGVMSVVIPRNTTIPCVKTEPFTTTESNQTTITIPIYEGERPQTKNNNLLGTFELTGIPPAPKGAAKIEISFDLDANGILKVTAQDKATGNQNRIIISNHKGRLSEAEITAMIDEAEKNKEADLKVKARVEAKNDLESYAFQMQSAMNDIKNMTVNDKDMMEIGINHCISWLDENSEDADISVIQSKRKDLEGLCAPIIAKSYAAKK